MRTVRAGLGAAVVVVALAACGAGADSTAQTGPAPSVSTSSASPAPSTPARSDDNLSPANLASELLSQLAAKGTFRVVSRTQNPGRDVVLVTADLKLTREGTDLVANGHGRKVVRTGQALYLKDAALTDSRSRPWLEIAGDGDAARYADQLVRAARVHEVIGGAAHATAFQRGDRVTVNGAAAQEYVVTLDLPRATAAEALGGFLTAADAKKLPEALTLRIAVDARCLPVQLRFTLDDADVVATFSRFGQKLTVTPPPAAKIGELDLS
ncbi:hypothetical protein BWI15_22435 [Kribbella sp. ALI-6-A]|uniref:hypothetical protein n=1 Tax=Kribbella sp. ALI-6-A TaxID=1933817 RepID=UPI00097C50D9|nr:hypothetical protein [Kribbella sp. ALI-6-A]ONI69356.1 hypothetical protein BWI15_22435 [Kribbella sp. ALI-6-A]